MSGIRLDGTCRSGSEFWRSIQQKVESSQAEPVDRVGRTRVGQDFVAAPGFMRSVDRNFSVKYSFAPVILESSQYGFMPKDGGPWNVLQRFNTRVIPRV